MVEEVAAMRIRPALVVLVAALTVGASGAGAVLDPTFGGDGRVRTRFPGGAYATDVAVVPAGGLVAVGAAAGPDDDGVFAVARYRNDGSLMTSFGDGGRVETPVSSGGDVADAVATSPGARVVAAGTAGREAFAVVRYLPDGSLDPSFGRGGVVRGAWRSAWFRAVAIGSDGSIVVGGDRDIFATALARFTPHGRLDPSFGGDGRVVLDLGTSEEAAVGVEVLAGGAVVGAGYAGPHESVEEQPFRFTAFRMRADGRLDPRFGEDGVEVTRFGDGALAMGATLASRGKLVVAGAAGWPRAEGFALVRYRV
jgi:uncharacterized delta-60 repeat protein